MKPYYDDGRGIVIYHGDCRAILPQLPKVDLVLADPPYGVNAAHWDRLPTQEELNMFLEISSNRVGMFGAAPPHCMKAVLSFVPLANRVYIWHSPFSLTNSDGAFWSYQPFYIWGEKVFCGIGHDVIIQNARDTDQKYHPTQKSFKLMNRLIAATNSDTILDPFMGSGTTLRAVKDLGRKAIGIEIEERYCEIAARRLQQEVLEFNRP